MLPAPTKTVNLGQSVSVQSHFKTTHEALIKEFANKVILGGLNTVTSKHQHHFPKVFITTALPKSKLSQTSTTAFQIFLRWYQTAAHYD